MVMTFWGSERFREVQPHSSEHEDITTSAVHDSDHGHLSEPHESPWTMTVPLVVLAILSTVGGLVGVPYALSGGKITNYFEHTLEPVIFERTAKEAIAADESQPKPTQNLSKPPQRIDGAPALTVIEGSSSTTVGDREHSPDEVRNERVFTVVSILIALIGIAIGWITFKKRPLLQMPRVLENKYYVDEIYNASVIDPINAGSREGLWKLFDVAVIDGIINGLGRSVTQVGGLVRYLQTGFVRSYAAVILFGALIVIAYFTYMFASNY
jgi:NADH-quinone oxidoreductase subunit L